MVNPNPIEKLWTVTRVMFDPCDAPFTLEARWLGNALLDLFLFFLNVDLMDVVTQGFRTRTSPYRPRSGRKGGRGSKAGRNPLVQAGKGLLRMDPSELAGHSLADLEKPTPFMSKPGVGLWILHGFLQRTVWQIFLAYVILDKWWQAMSMIDIYTFCDAADDTVLLVEGSEGIIQAISPVNPISFPTILKQRGAVSWNISGGAVGIPGASISAGFQARALLPVSEGATVYAELRVTTPSGTYTMDTAEARVQQLNDSFLALSATVAFPCTFAVIATMDYGQATLNSLALSLQAPDPESTH